MSVALHFGLPHLHSHVKMVGLTLLTLHPEHRWDHVMQGSACRTKDKMATSRGKKAEAIGNRQWQEGRGNRQSTMATSLPCMGCHRTDGN